MRFRVWIDPLYHKYSSETDPLYATEYEAEDDESAARVYAEDRYAELGHCDPCSFLVRDLKDGAVTGWKVEPRTVFVSKGYSVPNEGGDT